MAAPWQLVQLGDLQQYWLDLGMSYLPVQERKERQH